MASVLDQTRPRSDYACLLAEVTRAGLLRRSPIRYVPRLLTLAAATAGGLTAMVMLRDSWWQLAPAVLFAVVFAQVGFLGHDAGHQQIFRSRRANDRLGWLLATLGVGLSYRWWVDKHNRHHRHPNQVGRDPDVARNVLSWTEDQAAQQRGVLRWIGRHQAGMFFPLLLLEAWNLHVGSVRSVLQRRSLAEGALLLGHVAVGLTVLALVMSPVKVLVYVALQQCLFGLYLGCSFAPNHKGMPMLDGDEKVDFLRRQVLTSRNVSGGWFVTAALGGLNFQVEHHLFPSMASHNLRRCQPLVRRFCASHELPYVETTVLASYGAALRYLRSIRPRSVELSGS
jgi:fatty acid desaturase